MVPSCAEATKVNVIKKRKIAASREILGSSGVKGRDRAGVRLEAGQNVVLLHILSNLMSSISTALSHDSQKKTRRTPYAPAEDVWEII